MFEVLFDTEEQWHAFGTLPVVRAALDAVPNLAVASAPAAADIRPATAGA